MSLLIGAAKAALFFHGITDRLSGVFVCRHGRFDRWRWRPHPDPRALCHLSHRTPRHFGGHQQKCGHLGHGICHLPIQPKGGDALERLDACSHCRFAGLFAGRMDRDASRSQFSAQSFAVYFVGLVGLHPGQKKHGAIACAALQRSAGGCCRHGHWPADWFLRWLLWPWHRQLFCLCLCALVGL